MTLPGASATAGSRRRPSAHVRGCRPTHRRDGVGGPHARQFSPPASFENAIRVHMAIGGSTNAIIHVVAMARRAGIALSLEQFGQISTPAGNANPRPSGKYLIEDFFYAGGLPA